MQTVSALLGRSPEHLRTMTSELEQWMTDCGYKTQADIRGKLSQRHVSDSLAYTRAQYARLVINPQQSLHLG